VELMVLSYLDLGVLLGVGLFLSVGLLLIGRPYLVGDTIAFGRRTLAARRRIVPALQAQFHKLTTLGSRLRARRWAARLEEGEPVAEKQDSDAALQTDTASPADKDALPQAILDAAQDLHVEEANEVDSKHAKRSPRKNEVESPV
jgi:hypothetical protein